MGLATQLDADLTGLCTMLAAAMKTNPNDIKDANKMKGALTDINSIAGQYKKVHNSTYKRIKEHTDKLIKDATQLIKEIRAIEADLKGFQQLVDSQDSETLKLVEGTTKVVLTNLNGFVTNKIQKLLDAIKKEKVKVAS
jgi:hypothetical protein